MIGQANLVKLNGSVPSFIPPGAGRSVAQVGVDFSGTDIERRNERGLIETYSMLPVGKLTESVDYKTEMCALSTGMHYSWEMKYNEMVNHSIMRARAIMENTKIIVVIGYSFPVFNRLIDSYILSGFNQHMLNHKIFLQVPEEDYHTTKTRVERLTMRPDKADISHINDLSQFYIPFEFH